jgi:hypothetical protein
VDHQKKIYKDGDTIVFKGNGKLTFNDSRLYGKSMVIVYDEKSCYVVGRGYGFKENVTGVGYTLFECDTVGWDLKSSLPYPYRRFKKGDLVKIVNNNNNGTFALNITPIIGSIGTVDIDENTSGNNICLSGNKWCINFTHENLELITTAEEMEIQKISPEGLKIGDYVKIDRSGFNNTRHQWSQQTLEKSDKIFKIEDIDINTTGDGYACTLKLGDSAYGSAYVTKVNFDNHPLIGQEIKEEFLKEWSQKNGWDSYRHVLENWSFGSLSTRKIISVRVVDNEPMFQVSGCSPQVCMKVEGFEDFLSNKDTKSKPPTNASIELLIATAKVRYPNGTKYKSVSLDNFHGGSNCIVRNAECFKYYEQHQGAITDGHGGYVYGNGQWAEIQTPFDLGSISGSGNIVNVGSASGSIQLGSSIFSSTAVLTVDYPGHEGLGFEIRPKTNKKLVIAAVDKPVVLVKKGKKKVMVQPSHQQPLEVQTNNKNKNKLISL